MLAQFFDCLAEKHFIFVAMVLVSAFPLILCLDANVVLGEEYEAGIRPGDWIEYELNWTDPPAPPYALLIRREILDVSGSTVTVRILQAMSNGSVLDEIKEGDIEGGTGAAALVFIPPNSEPGHFVNIEGFGVVRINGTDRRTYLDIERNVLWADFSSMGFDVSVFWDREKGVALEIDQLSIRGQGIVKGITKIVRTNLWSAGADDEVNNDSVGVATLALVVSVAFILLITFVVWKRKVSSKRKRRTSSQRVSRSTHNWRSADFRLF